MSDPFNPRRFVYESNSQSDAVLDQREKETSTARARSGTDSISGPRGGLSSRTGPTEVPLEFTRTPKDAEHLSHRCTIFAGLCALMVVICSSYTLGRAAERSSLPSPSPINIPPAIQSYVDQAVLRLSRDPVRRPDFALYANGGRVIRDLTGIAHGDTLVLPYTDNPPNISLTDDMRVGSCWKFPQETGQLGFRTSEMLFPTHVTIDHIPIEIATDIGQAPRAMVLWGALDGGSNVESLQGMSGHPWMHIPPHVGRSEPRFAANLNFVILSTFDYDIYSPHAVQTFAINPLIVDARVFFGVFVLDVLSNWGGDATCLYRVRIHGEPAF